MGRILFIVCILLKLLSQKASAQSIYSFEGKKVPNEWTTDGNSKLLISETHFKDSCSSLQWNWNANATLKIQNFKNLKVNSRNPESVLWGWVYNAHAISDSIKFVFKDETGVERASFFFKINFKGWRFMWICFARDLNFQFSQTGHSLTDMIIEAPKKGNGTLYFDMFETRARADNNWHRASDKQYFVKEPKADTRNKSYDYQPPIDNIDIKDTGTVTLIKKRLYQWFVGDDNMYEKNPIYNSRLSAIEKGIFNKKNARWSLVKKLRFRNTDDGVSTTVVADTLDLKSKKYIGVGLHGDMTGYGYIFNEVNNSYLFDMALSVARYKGNDSGQKKRMIDSVIRVMDWMYDQGYAQGSGLGSGLTQLRSAGFSYAFFFIHQYITDTAKYEQYLNTIRWIARDSYEPDRPGSSADDIRGAMLSKLVYALCIKDARKRLAEMQYFKGFVENSLSISPGYYGLIKPDYSLYHHLMPYYSEYGDDAIHQAAIVLYLLKDTKYTLSKNTYFNIRNAVLNLTDISCNYEVPAGVSGRFPNNGKNILEHLPALAYVGLSTPKSNNTDSAVERTFVRLYRYAKSDPIKVGMDKTAMAIQYSQSLGAAIALITYDAMVPANQTGLYSLSKFLPFSGLHVVKYNDWSFSVKGFSKYITDFECIRNEGRYSRYISYGNFQLMNEKNHWNNYTSIDGFDYTHFAGTTTIALSLDKIDTRGKANNPKERNYGDETFLGGVALNDTVSMSAFNLHDKTFNASFRAKKSVFAVGNLVYFMGSDIENNDTQNETHTTLFQNVMQQKYLQEKVNVAEQFTYIQSPDTIKILKNSWKNTYIIYPQDGTYLHTEKRMQNNPDPTGKLPAKSTPYEIAWLNHGTNPSRKKYNYALLLNEDPDMQARLMDGSDPLIKIIQQDGSAHIIQTTINRNKVYGYAFFNPLYGINNTGPIVSVSAACMMIYTSSLTNTEIIFSNPDLNRPSANPSTERQAGKFVTTEILLNGRFQLLSADKGVSIQILRNGNTMLKIESQNGVSCRIILKKK